MILERTPPMVVMVLAAAAVAGLCLASCIEPEDVLPSQEITPSPEALVDSAEEPCPAGTQLWPHRQRDRDPAAAVGDAVCRRLPTPHINHTPDWCEPLFEVDLTSWAQSADDFIIGTVSAYRASWEPIRRLDREVDLDDCFRPIPALDVELSHVESLLGHNIPKELTVRVGARAFSLGSNPPLAEPGDDAVIGWLHSEQTDGPPEPLQMGMQLGGALYHFAGLDQPVFLSPSEPLFEIVDGRVWFQELLGDRCHAVQPSGMALNGLTVQQVADALQEAAGSDRRAEADLWREFLHVDDETSPVRRGPAAVCLLLNDERQAEPDPISPPQCTDDADCVPPEVCRWEICLIEEF